MIQVHRKWFTGGRGDCAPVCVACNTDDNGARFFVSLGGGPATTRLCASCWDQLGVAHRLIADHQDLRVTLEDQ